MFIWRGLHERENTAEYKQDLRLLNSLSFDAYGHPSITDTGSDQLPTSLSLLSLVNQDNEPQHFLRVF